MSTIARLVIVRVEGNTVAVAATGRFEHKTPTWDPTVDAARLMLDIVSYEISLGATVEYQIVGEVDKIELNRLKTLLGSHAHQFVNRDAPRSDSRTAA